MADLVRYIIHNLIYWFLYFRVMHTTFMGLQDTKKTVTVVIYSYLYLKQNNLPSLPGNKKSASKMVPFLLFSTQVFQSHPAKKKST